MKHIFYMRDNSSFMSLKYASSAHVKWFLFQTHTHFIRLDIHFFPKLFIAYENRFVTSSNDEFIHNQVISPKLWFDFLKNWMGLNVPINKRFRMFNEIQRIGKFFRMKIELFLFQRMICKTIISCIELNRRVQIIRDFFQIRFSRIEIFEHLQVFSIWNIFHELAVNYYIVQWFLINQTVL